jgi:membrane protein DedA with SNARE-associated domain
LQSITDLIIHINPLLIYLIVIVILLLESSGIPIANNTLLLFTGALASQGHLNIWMLIIVAILGSISGACLAYFLGVRGGRRIFVRVAAFFRVNEQKVNRTESWFKKHGLWMVFFSRMTPYVRPYTCFLGGISHLPLRRFFFAALTGSIIWCIVMLNVGMVLGSRWQQGLLLMQNYTMPTLCVLSLLLALYFFLQYAIGRYLRSKFPPVPEPVESEIEQGRGDLLPLPAGNALCSPCEEKV